VTLSQDDEVRQSGAGENRTAAHAGRERPSGRRFEFPAYTVERSGLLFWRWRLGPEQGGRSGLALSRRGAQRAARTALRSQADQGERS
jgi:hypothetical protein